MHEIEEDERSHPDIVLAVFLEFLQCFQVVLLLILLVQYLSFRSGGERLADVDEGFGDLVQPQPPAGHRPDEKEKVDALVVQLLDIVLVAPCVVYGDDVIESDAVESYDIAVEIEHLLDEFLQPFLVDVFIGHLVSAGRVHRIREQEFRVLEILYVRIGLDIVDHVVLSSDGGIFPRMEFVEEDLFDGFLSGDLLLLQDEILHQALEFPFALLIEDDLDLLSLIHEDVFGAGVLEPEREISSVHIIDLLPFLEDLLEEIARHHAMLLFEDAEKITQKIVLHGLEFVERESFVHERLVVVLYKFLVILPCREIGVFDGRQRVDDEGIYSVLVCIIKR